jgi:branched-chain amino acid transport system permease protein
VLDQLLSWDLVFNAVTLGAVYALIAVGYTMVYGIIKLINFAHGEVFMMGTYFGLLVVANGNLPLALAILIAMAGCILLGVVLDFGAYLPLRRDHPLADTASLAGLLGFSLLTLVYFELGRRQASPTVLGGVGVLLGAIPLGLFVMAILGLKGRLGRPRKSVSSDRLSALITAIGMSLALQTIAQLIWGADMRAFPSDSLPAFFSQEVLSIGGARLLGKELVIWIAAVVLMLGLDYLVNNTRIGKAMRACALDKETASLMGVNVDSVIAVTFMIGSAMAAVAGILYAIKVGGNISFRMGYYPGVIAFAAAVLGGIGNLRGAFLGGFIIGLTEAVGVLIAPPYKFAFAFGLMIAVILFRPWGLLGRGEAKRA